VRLADLFLEDDPFEVGAPAQGDIDLAVSEGAAADVDDDSVESLPLALVDGDGPGQAERILDERADSLGDEFSRPIVVVELEELPGVGLDGDFEPFLELNRQDSGRGDRC
jgi:hypothetical protein